MKHGILITLLLPILQMPMMRQVIVSLYLIKSAKTHLFAVLPFGHARLFIKHYNMLVTEERFVLMEGTVSHIHTAVFQKMLLGKRRYI